MTAAPVSPARHTAQAPRRGAAGSLLIDLVFALTIASLFIPWEAETPVGKTRLFDYFSVLCALVMMSRMGHRGFILPMAVLPHLGWVVVYVVSAFTIAALNGIREVVQISTVLIFLSTILAYANQSPRNRIFLLSSIFLILITIVNILWHVQQGVWVGWKQLDEPKSIFIFLPAMLAAVLAPFGRRQPVWALPLIGFVFLIVVLSGERKAYMTGALFVIGYFGLINPRMLFAAAAGIVALLFLSQADPEGYIARQISTIVNPPTVDVYTLDYINMPESISNAQRQFATELGLQLFSEKPIFGIGTNTYGEIMNSRYGYLPGYLRLDIHGEFLRSLVENGLIGVGFYIAGWIVSAITIARAARIETILFGMHHYGLVLVLLFGGFLAFAAFEAQKSLSLIAYFAPPLLPILLRAYLPQPRRRPSAQRVRPAAPAHPRLQS
ncbi:MAG: O-antigen ligase family protein [Hyphomonadaceae bacterium]